jgi:hypothetical protein
MNIGGVFALYSSVFSFQSSVFIYRQGFLNEY